MGIGKEIGDFVGSVLTHGLSWFRKESRKEQKPQFIGGSSDVRRANDATIEGGTHVEEEQDGPCSKR